MNTSESISNLFNLGVHQIIIGRATPEHGKKFIGRASQYIHTTGCDQNNTIGEHNVFADTVGECLQQLTGIVTDLGRLSVAPSGIIKLPPSGRAN